MMKFALLLSLAAVAFAAPNKLVIDTVPELDVAKYLGQWKQLYGNRFGWFSYGEEAICITATYGIISSDTVSVFNANRVTTPDGEQSTINGEAYLTDEPGKLVVQLEGVPFPASYWVVQLGPADFGEDNLYQYAIVTNDEATALFVLTRDVNEFKEKYEQNVLSFLRDNNFTTFLKEPLEIYQGDDCLYPE